MGPVGVFQVGDSVADVSIVGGGGAGSTLPERGTVVSVVLAFSSECMHCATVAPAWAEWMRRPHAGVRVLAVSPEPLDEAQDYATRWAWSAEVASTRLEVLTDQARRLTSRTPWLFLIDAAGRVLFEAHGARLSDLDRAIQNAAQLSASSPPQSPDASVR
jgi:hypothetical protein